MTAGADLVVSGVPLDLATTFRPGARLGPAAIRAATVQLAELHPFPWGFDPFDDLAVIDYGDCWFDAHRASTIHATIVAHANPNKDQVTIPVYQKTVWIMEATSQTPRRYTREPGLRALAKPATSQPL